MSFQELKNRGIWDRIFDWDESAIQESNGIKRFILRWIAFNGLYSALYSMVHGQENTENASDEIKLRHFFINLILKNEIPAEEIYSEGFKELLKKEIRNKKGSIGKLLKNLDTDIDIKEKSRDIIEIAYKIRCRLFHSEKDTLYDINESLCEVVDNIIAKILNYIKSI
ncbi:MAG: hypothetical protein ACFE8N_04085 [Promethearchaeota archaeon]